MGVSRSGWSAGSHRTFSRWSDRICRAQSPWKEDAATSVADPGQSMQETVSSGGDDTDDEIDNI